MTALTNDRNTNSRAGDVFSDPVAASAKIYAGALVMINATGYLAPGSTATGLKARGVAQEQVDNSAGADGDLNCVSHKGTFKLANDGTIKAVDVDGVWVEIG